MYEIIKIDGTELGITDSVNYIKFGASGCYTTASEKDAIGVAFNGVPYNIVGHNDISGAETVIVSRINGGSYIFEQKKASFDIDALIIDNNYRLTLLELGVTG